MNTHLNSNLELYKFVKNILHNFDDDGKTIYTKIRLLNKDKYLRKTSRGPEVKL